MDLHFGLDNYTTHQHAKVKAWLQPQPRAHLHFVPTSSSWLNLAERLFPELDQRQLKYLAATSVPELETTIVEYLEDRNRDPRPLVWTAWAEAPIEKVQRGNMTLATLNYKLEARRGPGAKKR